MCSTPKGGRTKPLLGSHVDSTFGDMSSAEYSDMVRRANENYEYRQRELTKLRKKRRKTETPPIQHAPIKVSFYEKAKIFLSRFISVYQ